MSFAFLDELPAVGACRFSRIANLVLLPFALSTNAVARAFVERMQAEDSDVLPTVFLTRRQMVGQGRAGRSWSTPEGGLALSVILPLPEPALRVRLPIAFGIGMARALGDRLGVAVRLKWPNDLQVGGRKVGGLLVVARPAPGGEEEGGYAIAGLGLNLSVTRDSLDRLGLHEATSFREEGASKDLVCGRDGVLNALLAVDDALAVDVTSLDLPEAYAGVAAHQDGDELSVHVGERLVTGRYAGVTADGLLRLLTPEGVETLVSGDVLSVPSAA